MNNFRNKTLSPNTIVDVQKPRTENTISALKSKLTDPLVHSSMADFLQALPAIDEAPLY